jgi:hypothetical protein
VSESPKRYRIADLLEHSVQPFDDLTGIELERLGEDIDPDLRLTVPVVINEDDPPRLVNGNQRLRILASKGRTEIKADEVVIEPRANGSNAVLWAVSLNARGRQLTPRDKGRYARDLQATYGWSTTVIASAMGTSQSNVHRWLKAAGGPVSRSTVGEDGKVYTTSGPDVPEAREPPAGDYEGSLLQAVRDLQDESLAVRPGVKRALLTARVDRKGIGPADWKVTFPPEQANATEHYRQLLLEHADDLKSLARRIEQALPWKVK